ncbi:MAG: AmmeMemoRadiSam system radical SAM enzyme [Dehalococcoidales bacterium]|nr:AmmeMemoRadiSam system radical SAM enzyme [Dehalococcoidales bacterium]
MREALLYEKLSGARVRCGICQWRCIILPDQTGVCRMYRNLQGTLQNLNYSLASSLAVDPIEKKPLFHFYPGTKVFSLGGWGCNFHCADCQNWEISMVEDVMSGARVVTPEQAVQLAKQYDCAGMAWTYNEPSMWFEYTLDSARLAKKAGLYTVYVTNGYLSSEALDMIGPYLDAWRVDVKGFTDGFYQQLAKIPHWRGILEVAERARHKWHMHVEVVTNVIPTMNDDDDQLSGIAAWIAAKLGADVPWHVTRYHPAFKINQIPATPLATMEHAYALGKQAGLKYVYLGNVSGHPSENTDCPACGQPVVKRLGYETQVTGLNGSCCRFCGTDLNFRTGEIGGEGDED